jgi:hypothetical protein
LLESSLTHSNPNLARNFTKNMRKVREPVVGGERACLHSSGGVMAEIAIGEKGERAFVLSPF